ncbi:hypothetical protein H7347_10370 [Corynebacterium sp. zg-331]|uniref:hypothetical protein n=1 Tax=unclassified Corynebacterium TaxID=2624378 RepID=UPI00128C7CF6|nr:MULTISPECIES: hypothetical protein [unclassified Corynebacterium]MBC3186961.1 hypothetical protein [Corynebacterium sp. zg-331]MPV53438.1 hypothetical protein [Corynebacterium sp. zg331]
MAIPVIALITSATATASALPQIPAGSSNLNFIPNEGSSSIQVPTIPSIPENSSTSIQNLIPTVTLPDGSSFTPIELSTINNGLPEKDKTIGNNYDELIECLDYLRGANDPLTLFHGKDGATATLNCGAARHIILDNGRLPYPPNPEQWADMQACMARVFRADDWSGANIPNTGYKRFNTYSNMWSYLVVNPQGYVATAWAGEGTGDNWGSKGCLAGMFGWKDPF